MWGGPWSPVTTLRWAISINQSFPIRPISTNQYFMVGSMSTQDTHSGWFYTEMKYVEHKCAYTWESAPGAVDDIGDTDGRQLPQFPNQRRRSAFEMIMMTFRNLATTP